MEPSHADLSRKKDIGRSGLTMGQAYVPGLKVTKRTLLHKERRLPLKGKVLVQPGEKVQAETVVAKTDLPGRVELVNVANQLGIEPQAVKKAMRKKEGEKVTKGEILAQNVGLFGLFKSQCQSPITGFVETISDDTGKVTLREDPIPVELKAFVEGEVESILPEEGIVLRTWGAYVQGIFGIGGETWGKLSVVATSPDEILDERKIFPNFSGAILVGGSLVTLSALKKGVDVGVKGIVVGGIDDQDLKDFLGYDLGVAITGTENKGITLVITEGFGKIRMAEKTFKLLKECEGRLASINGATQIRAGVIRPEVIVPFVEEGIPKTYQEEESTLSGLAEGRMVRIIREPNFGELARVISLPSELQKIETEAKVRVVELKLANGTTTIVPRANVELIEET
jgi:hypothetical protein